MKKFVGLLGFLCLMVPAYGLAGGEHATKEEAVAMVDKAVHFVEENGAAKAYEVFNDRVGPFVDRDLYIMVYDLNGKCLAHGANSKLIGMDLIDAQDVDGKFYVKERVETAKTKNSYWLDYKFADPVTRKLEPKSTYCRRLGDTVICAGVYNPS
jgi:cytochrome c